MDDKPKSFQTLKALSSYSLNKLEKKQLYIIANRICVGVEAETGKSQASFQII